MYDCRRFTLNKSQGAETVNIIQFIYLKTNKKHCQTKMFSKNAYSLWFPVDIPCMFFLFVCFFLQVGMLK